MSGLKKLKLAGIGCGGRTRTYLRLAGQMPTCYEVVAASDPITERVEWVRQLSHNPHFRAFRDDREILAQPKLADIMVIGTQDRYHFEPCLAAMEKGYDILLEKPIATSLEEVIRLEKAAVKMGRKVLVCHVLRYAPFYRKIKEIIDSGVLGRVLNINATEGVGAWHQAHSYVRGHWAVTEKSSPMIIAKSCHDMDILSWLVGRRCLTVSSFGSLSHFTRENAPPGAPLRCTDGCPIGASCRYNAMLYTSSHKDALDPVLDDARSASQEEIVEWLKKSPYGRCVYHCDNTAVDHQVVSLLFEGDATATFTMSAFDEGRTIEIFGTNAHLRGGHFYKKYTSSEIFIREHETQNMTRISVDQAVGGYGHHLGGDPGLMLALYNEMLLGSPVEMHSSISKSVESHVMGFAAEHSRVTGRSVSVPEFYKQHASGL